MTGRYSKRISRQVAQGKGKGFAKPKGKSGECKEYTQDEINALQQQILRANIK